MKIKTTSEIESRLRELILDAKDLERIDKREDYCKKQWIAVDKEVVEALIFFQHLKNHPEVKEARDYTGIPMCKICGKPSTIIALEECLKELDSRKGEI